MSVLGWAIFVVALLFSVMLHETGHFVAAKRFGMKVTQYFVGFGTTLWSTTRGETEYGIKVLPFGGFVKIVGMTSMDEVDPADEPRSFRRHPAWQRLIVLFAGSFMHFVLAFVLLFLVAGVIGLESESNAAQLGPVSTCVPASAKALDSGTCTSSDQRSPATVAGFKAGDKVISFDNKPVSTWTALGSDIKNTPAHRSVPVVVERDGQRLTLHVTLATVAGRTGSYLGVQDATDFQRYNPARSVTYAGSTFGAVLTGSVKVIGQLPSAVPHLFAKNRAHTSAGQVTSVVGAGEITGDVVSANTGWQVKVDYVLLIMASLNIFVGAFNLLPLLPLDGGHIAVVIYERVRSWFARLRNRPSPGLVDMTKLVPLSMGVFAVLVFFGLILIVADLVNPVGIPT
ncbi:MAG TPA: site-2 protease family protein [Streptosporangiaceae bacterium]|jgi:membrane-associated protease RseP (regulator of RpoE activity)